MTIQETFYSTLQATFGGALYPNTAPDSPTAPYGVYMRVHAVPENNLGGFANLTNTRMQLDLWASTYAGVQALAAAARTAMDASAMKQTCEMEQDLYEGDVKLHRVIQEFSIWH